MNKNIKFHGNLKTNDMIIHWLPTNYCNYNCSYCIGHAPIVNKNMDKIIDSLAWWIPVKKLRDNFRSKFL